MKLKQVLLLLLITIRFEFSNAETNVFTFTQQNTTTDSLSFASFRVTFGVKDTSAKAWDGEILPANGQILQLEVDHFRNHTYEAKGWSPQGITSIKLGDSKFENDYIKNQTTWVCSTREASLHGPTTEWHDYGQINSLHTNDPLKPIIQQPTLLIHLRSNSLNTPVNVKTVQGSFSFTPQQFFEKRTERFLDGNVKVEIVPSVQVVSPERVGHQDFSSMVISRKGKLWMSWQEFNESKESDEVLVRSQENGKWDSLTVLAEKADAFHTAMAEDSRDRIWSVWSMQVDGKWDLYGRFNDGGSWSAQQRLTNSDASKNIYHKMVTDSEGRMWLVWQRTAGKFSQIYAKYFDGEKWSAEEQISEGKSAEGNNWWPAVSAGANGSLAIAWDGYASGSYDIYLRKRKGNSWEKTEVIAGTANFEAHPTVAFDKMNRIWVAWDESGANWGKDTGLLVEDKGVQLHQSRSIQIVCFDGTRWTQPNELTHVFPKNDFWELPSLQIDSEGNPWLFVRHMIMRQPDTPLEGPIDMALWEIFASRYNGSEWSEPMYLPRSTGRNEMMPATGLSPDGNMWAVWSTDNRDVRSFQSNQLQVQLGRIGQMPEAKPVVLKTYQAMKAVSFKPFDLKEKEQVKEIQGYKIKHDGKVYSIYRGDLHRHTDNSVDGMNDGSLLDAYRYARDAASMDFLGVADHTDAIWEKYAWWRNQKVADLFQVKNNFAALYGYERSVEYPNGHRNIFFAKRGAVDYILPIGSAESRGLEGNQRLYWYLRRFNGISIPHTTGRTSGTDWRDNDSKVEPLIELFQGMRDTYEYPGAPHPYKLNSQWVDSLKYVPRASSSERSPSFKPLGFAWKALDKGYKLGFIASSDHISTHIAYACMIAENLSPEGLMEAAKARRTYAATDNIIMDIRHKGSDGEHLTGDIFNSNQPLQIKGKIIGTGEIQQIDIISNGAIIKTYKPNREKYSFEFVEPANKTGEIYYYVRVIQKDGEMAWGSPVWVTYAK